MSKIRKLDNPPIREAIIEFQFQPFLEFEKDKIENLLNELKSDFHNFNYTEKKEAMFGIKLNEPLKMISEPTSQLNGIILKDKNEEFVLQFQMEKLSVIKSKPYNKFEQLLEKALWFFDKTKEFIKDKNISRIGLRYINEINFKNNFVDLFEKNPLIFFQKKNKDLKRMFNQSIFEHSDYEGSIVNLVIDINFKQAIIDIDCYNNQIQNTIDIKKITEVLKNLHKNKNSIFFQIVSNKLEEALKDVSDY